MSTQDRCLLPVMVNNTVFVQGSLETYIIKSQSQNKDTANNVIETKLLKWLKVSHLDCNLYHKLIIPRVVHKQYLLQILHRSIN